VIKLISNFLGLDYSFLNNKDLGVLYQISIIMLIILVMSLLGLMYGFKLAFDSIFISVFVSVFIVLFLYNFYRLIFSIIEGELEYKSKKIEIFKFITKRSIVLVLMSLFISKSLQSYVFENTVSYYLDDYKIELKKDFNKKLEFSYGSERDLAIENFKKLRISELEKDSILSLVELKIESKRNEINYAISESNFFITRISIVSGKMPYSWIITILIVSLFLSPIYLFITHPVFRKYDVLSREVNNRIILDHYEFFKRRYNDLMKESTGINIEFVEKFQDPPFNTIEIKSSKRYLKKGSLLKWFKKYG
jgi:hypothetical protein